MPTRPDGESIAEVYRESEEPPSSEKYPPPPPLSPRPPPVGTACRNDAAARRAASLACLTCRGVSSPTLLPNRRDGAYSYPPAVRLTLVPTDPRAGTLGILARCLNSSRRVVTPPSLSRSSLWYMYTLSDAGGGRPGGGATGGSGIGLGGIPPGFHPRLPYVSLSLRMSPDVSRCLRSASSLPSNGDAVVVSAAPRLVRAGICSRVFSPACAC